MPRKQDILYDHLKETIGTESYPDGRLPTEKKLAASLSVSQSTLRKALARLESEHLIERIPSRGTFVCPPAERKKRLIALETLSYQDVSNPTGEYLMGLRNACEQRKMDLQMLPLPVLRACPERETIRKFRDDNGIAGFVLFGGQFSGREDYIRILQEVDKPTVILGGYPGDDRTTGFTSVHIDVRAAWEDATLTLAGLGHRRIGFLSSPVVRGYGENFTAWHAFLRAHDLYAPELLKSIRMVPVDEKALRRAFDELLALPDPPTALLCFSDILALRIYTLAAEKNMRIPDDLAVMGFCHLSGLQYLPLSLSTVDFHYRESGEEAVRIIAENRSGHFERAERIIPYEIILAESTARNPLPAATPHERRR